MKPGVLLTGTTLLTALFLTLHVADDIARGAPCTIEWDGRDGTGRRVAPGTYVWRVTGAGAPAAGRVTLIR